MFRPSFSRVVAGFILCTFLLTSDAFGDGIICQSRALLGVHDTIYTVNDIEIDGDLAFMAGNGLWIIDITSPDSPQIVSEITSSGTVGSVDVQGSLIYYANYDTLHIADISEPSVPNQLSQTELPGDSESLEVVGTIAYIGMYDTASDGLLVYDVADPSKPSLIASIPTTRYAFELAMVGEDLVCVAAGIEGLALIDVSDHTMPLLIDKLTFGSSVAGVHTDGSFAYASLRGGGTVCIDLSDPYKPIIAHTYAQPAQGLRSSTGDGKLYITGDNYDCVVYDISDPYDPSMLGYLSSGADISSVEVDSRFALIGSHGSGMLIIDVDGYDDGSSLLATIDTPGSVYDLDLEGQTCFVTGNASDRLQAFDISDPSNPIWVGGFDGLSSPYGVRIQDGYAYVPDGSSGLRVLDVRDPSQIIQVGSYPASSLSRSVVLSGSIAFLVDFFNGIDVLDISDPTSPQQLSSVPFNSLWIGDNIAADNGVLYLADSSFGFRTVDVSDPSNPFFLAQEPFAGQGASIQIMDDLCFYSNVGSLLIYDVSDPSHPVRLSEIDTPNGASSIGIQDGYAYLTTTGTGVVIADVRDPTAPRIVWIEQHIEEPRQFRMHNGQAYVADFGVGVRIFDVSDCLACPSDLNGDGVLNFFDVSSFLVAFIDQDTTADLNADGTFNFFDVSAFLVAFNQGCP